jgi:hypothetical protein
MFSCREEERCCSTGLLAKTEKRWRGSFPATTERDKREQFESSLPLAEILRETKRVFEDFSFPYLFFLLLEIERRNRGKEETRSYIKEEWK